MIPVVAGALVGAWLVGRTKPKTRVLKRELIGPLSGLVYQAEEFPEARLILLTIKSQCRVVLEREPDGSLTIRSAEGAPQALAAVKKDFGRS